MSQTVSQLLVSALFLSACKGGDGLTASDIEGIRVEPESVTLTVTDGAPAQAEFVAWAQLKDDGGEVPLSLVSWESSNLSAGSIDADGVFTSVDTNGGVTEIIASHVGIEGSATLNVVYTTAIFDEGLDADVAEAFDAATSSEDAALVVRYPPDGVTVPRNLTGLSFVWDDTQGADVYRIRFRSEITDISVYTTADVWTSTSDLWELISAANTRGEVSVTMEAGKWDGATLSAARQGASITLTVNRLDARGSVLYWETANEAIKRIPFGSTSSELFWPAEASSGGNYECIGCHVVVETDDNSEDAMVVTHGGINGQFSVVDISSPEEPYEIVSTNTSNRMTFKTVSPDGRYVLGTTDNTVTLYELRSGNRIKDITFSDKVSHPDWSPDGESVLLVKARTSVAGESFTANSDMDFERGEIVEFTWDADALELTDERVIKPPTVDAGFYYPAYSPDGEWIAYNRSQTSSYAAEDAELWLMSRDGSVDVRLDAANGVGDLQNSYSRWGPLPDDDVLWLAFSSRREYPVVSGEMPPQIWVAAINPALAEEGSDPSSTPFWLPGQDLQSDNHLPVWWSQ